MHSYFYYKHRSNCIQREFRIHKAYLDNQMGGKHSLCLFGGHWIFFQNLICFYLTLPVYSIRLTMNSAQIF